MYRIRIFIIGKNKERWLKEAVEQYQQRMKATTSIEWIECRNNAQLIKQVESLPHVVCLDEKGQLMSSVEFSGWLTNKLQSGGSRLDLVIGGAEGLPESLRQLPSISLSPMTLTHQAVRLFLVEQIYRGLEIAAGSPYHKE
jgi:23S rRNA (pseudouridine1915-N3)-methyltransferase